MIKKLNIALHGHSDVLKELTHRLDPREWPIDVKDSCGMTPLFSKSYITL